MGKGEEGVATHDDGMARGECLEALQVIREPVNQFVLETYGSVPSHRCYYRNHIFIIQENECEFFYGNECGYIYIMETNLNNVNNLPH